MTSFMEFKDKVVVVTGGTNGIGKALVEYFLSVGAKVATCSRHFDDLYNLQTQHSEKHLYVNTADVSSEKDCELFINKTVNAWGTIDILINNAGISMRSEFAETEFETIRKLMDINFWGTVYCTKFALPHIIKSKGMIVGVSSIAGLRGLPGRSGYAASKHAMNGFLESIKVELADEGVHVMWVCPGFTASNIRKVALTGDAKPAGDSLLDEKKLMSSQEVAAEIVTAIKKKKRLLVLTAQGKQTAWANRLIPYWLDKKLRKFYYNEDGKLIK